MDQSSAKVALVAGVTVASLGVGLGLGAYVYNNGHPRKSGAGRRRVGQQESSAWSRQLAGSVYLPAKESGVTFGSFPYYLSQRSRDILVKTAFLPLTADAKAVWGGRRPWTQQKPTLLLTGKADLELYMQNLGKAMATHFQASLLVVDAKHEVAKFAAGSKSGSFGKITTQGGALPAGDVGPPCGLWEGLGNVLRDRAKSGPVVCYIRDIDVAMAASPDLPRHLQALIQDLPRHLFLLGSSHADSPPSDLQNPPLDSLFPTRLPIGPPSDAVLSEGFGEKVAEDGLQVAARDNRNLLLQVLSTRNVECDMDNMSFKTNPFTVAYAEKVVGWSVSHHLMSQTLPAVREGRLQLPTECLEYGLSLSSSSEAVYVCDQKKNEPNEPKNEAEKAKEGQTETKELQDSAGVKVGGAGAGAGEVKADSEVGADAPKKVEAAIADLAAAAADEEATKKPPPPAKVEVEDNEFEKRIRPEVLSPTAVGVSFDSIGALTKVKDSLRELVMLPLQRPELFKTGGLVQPCKGILLFGPPGTGKTMLAKAVATEAGANFINISMSTITSKWFGEDEKNVRALFSLAAKIAPTVIFIDEVDSMLGRRSRAGEHEAMRKIKNEFMAHWDGLMSKANSGVLVLAATNRPFDLDEAIIRRFQRRIMVSLPDPAQRELILRSILRNENLPEEFSYKELADLTEGHSGSDLKNLCITAAYQPIRELLAQERKMKEEVEKGKEAAKTSATPSEISATPSATPSAETSAAITQAAETVTPEPSTLIPAVGVSTSASDEVQEGEAQVSKKAEVAAAVVETVQVETTVAQEKATEGEEAKKEEGEAEVKGKVGLRGLTMEDLKFAKSQFAASVAMEGASMAELNEWNELYGEGGKRKKPMLSYFL